MKNTFYLILMAAVITLSACQHQNKKGLRKIMSLQKTYGRKNRLKHGMMNMGGLEVVILILVQQSISLKPGKKSLLIRQQ